ncbi:MAG: tRNA pseudouridine(55) synthase TruB [Planctomycetaceae bacterium]|nr:tRNA pseudouridine(55) synthase TruB [Planctomycetaceae bacterium]
MPGQNREFGIFLEKYSAYKILCKSLSENRIRVLLSRDREDRSFLSRPVDFNVETWIIHGLLNTLPKLPALFTHPMNGLLILDKPAGMTSRDAVNRVQRLIRPCKVGHAGTLDPLATGVLVLCLGKATRLIRFVQDRPKSYLGTFELGVTSTTDDREGELTATDNLKPLEVDELQAVLPRFQGEIQQVPPRFSAVHVNGQRAYKLARQEADFELEPRSVRIDSIELTAWSFPRFSLQIVCGSGTYIRSLGRDIGAQLGCGAYMTDLIRTSIGDFPLERALSLDELSLETIEQHLIPPGEAVRHLPKAIVHSSQHQMILDGKQFEPELPEVSSGDVADSRPFAVYDESDQLVCLAEAVPDSTRLQPRQVYLERD